MQQDLLNIVGLGVLPALALWNYEPALDTPITFDSKKLTWSILDKNKTLYSGKISPGNTFSGVIKVDGTFCVQAQSVKGTSVWRLDSTTGKLTSGSCV
jgi:hypothetical protein